MATETGKHRRARIDYGYYRKPDALVRLRNSATLLIVAIAVGWLIAAPDWSSSPKRGVRFFRWNQMASPGALASPHAMWNSKCDACHDAFAPINRSQWAPSLALGPHDADAKCVACHKVADHSSKQHPSEIAACADCHRDHQGGDISLICRDDQLCTRCHAQIASHGTSPTVADVRQFAPGEHPEFTVSSGTAVPVAFNHALHLSENLIKPSDDQRTRSTVQLDCAACHRLEPDARARMMPVSYENNCRACHPLTFDSNHPESQLEHGLQVAEVVAKVQESFAARAVLESPASLRRALSSTSRWLPGHGDPEDPQLAKAIDDNVTSSLRLLFGAANSQHSRRGCVGCHEFEPALPKTLTPSLLKGVIVRPVRRGSAWYSAAVFDHRAHRAKKCAECHADAYTSTKSTDVLLPSMATCLKCHGASTASSSEDPASSACVECHRYHPRDKEMGNTLPR